MTKKTSKPKREATGEQAASDASFAIREGDAIINEALGFVHDVAVRARVKKYHRAVKSAAASALTQREK